MNFLRKDLKEDAKIARKRLLEAERKKRIFDPKTRIIGVDIDGLEKQIQAKEKQKEFKRREDEIYARKKLEEDQFMLEQERANAKKRQLLEKRLVEFRDKYQRRPKPSPRGSYSDNGVSRFEGEDVNYKKRLSIQKEENRAWLLQQIAEKRQLADEEMARQAKVTEAQILADKRAKEIGELEEMCRTQLYIANAQYNKLSAQEREAREKAEEERRAAEEAEEIRNWITGDWLTENPQVAKKGHRVIPYLYKGEPHESLLTTVETQKMQKHQKELERDMERIKTKEWEEFQRKVNQYASDQVRKLMTSQRDLDKSLATINNQLAEEQRQREAKNNDLSGLKPLPEFFEKFNATTY